MSGDEPLGAFLSGPDTLEREVGDVALRLEAVMEAADNPAVPFVRDVVLKGSEPVSAVPG
jgi:hypothetical protein